MTAPTLPLPISLVTSNAELAACAAEWRHAPQLALDTEFVRESTFRPIAGLVQVGTDAGCWLLDPLAIDDWSPLSTLLQDETLPKVVHACGEDLELLLSLTGVLPRPLYDTQIGAGLAGLGFGLSYQALVERVLGIAVEKEHTRSNWIARPLSEAQLHYAALDVAWLGPLFRHISQQLSEQNRLSWWREEGDRAALAAQIEPAPDQYYLRLGAGWRLRGLQVAALQGLCAWREREARRSNVPRGWLLKDHECLEIARRLPRSMAELAAVPELQPRRVREQGKTILGLLEAARAMPAEQWPSPAPPPLSRADTARLRQMRSWSDRCAAEIGIAPELLVRKRDCEQLLRTQQLPTSLQGWRQPLVAETLLSIAAQAGSDDGDLDNCDDEAAL